MKRRSWLLITLVAGAGVAGAAGYVLSTTRAPAAGHRTVRIERGAIVASVSATGTLAAVTTVQVGSQVSGQIKELLVDFNSPVRQGQLIARLDPDLFQARVNAARADLDSAQAQVLNQRANVEKVRADVENARAGATTAEANVERVRADGENARAAIATAQANVARESATQANARRELDRRLDLLRRDLIAQSEKDQAQTAFDTATAQLEAARAQERAGQAGLRSALAQLAAVESQARAAGAQVASAQAALAVAAAQLKAAEATVRQKQAALEQARLDLERTEIRAPVNGVVVSRSVDVGQTVAASLQAPTLFTIAQDLTRMQVEAAIDEADVGRLREGMAASFTVDAFPGQTFRGEIVQIRKAAQVIQNVVSYTTVIAVANPNRILLPGMTANVRIQVARREDALRVPNAALRYRPPGEGDASGPARPPAPAPPAAAGAGGAGGGLRELRETLVRDLGLGAEQQVKLDAILEDARQAFTGLRARGLDETAAQAERRRLGGELREKIAAILTAEQRGRYQAMAAAQGGGRGPGGTPGRVFVPGPGGKPAGVAIVVGITDGSYSEVVGGELRAGQEVIVGQAPSNSSRTGSAGPRLRL